MILQSILHTHDQETPGLVSSYLHLVKGFWETPRFLLLINPAAVQLLLGMSWLRKTIMESFLGGQKVAQKSIMHQRRKRPINLDDTE